MEESQEHTADTWGIKEIRTQITVQSFWVKALHLKINIFDLSVFLATRGQPSLNSPLLRCV